jgi:hypothetical protein
VVMHYACTRIKIRLPKWELSILLVLVVLGLIDALMELGQVMAQLNLRERLQFPPSRPGFYVLQNNFTKEVEVAWSAN